MNKQIFHHVKNKNRRNNKSIRTNKKTADADVDIDSSNINSLDSNTVDTYQEKVLQYF